MVRTVANMSVHENIYSNNIDIWCTQRQLSENICSEDDLRSAISEHFSKNFREPFLWQEIFEKVSFNPYNFRITRLSARKSEQKKYFGG